MPPHPASFFHKSIYDSHGHYLTSFKTGADYEMFVRLLLKKKLSFTHINKILIKMRTGGATSSGFNSIRTTSSEMVKALKLHGFYTNLFIIYLRLPFKLLENLSIYPKSYSSIIVILFELYLDLITKSYLKAKNYCLVSRMIKTITS